MADAAKNMGASVRARLLTHSQATRQTFETVLTRYALERLAAKWLVRPCLDFHEVRIVYTNFGHALCFVRNLHT
ncbi:hypothetical protein D3C80_1497610 [compost metagenome]